MEKVITQFKRYCCIFYGCKNGRHGQAGSRAAGETQNKNTVLIASSSESSWMLGLTQSGGITFSSFGDAKNYMQKMLKSSNRMMVGFGLADGGYVVLPQNGYRYNEGKSSPTDEYVENPRAFGYNTDVLPYRDGKSGYEVMVDGDYHGVSSLIVGIPDVNRYDDLYYRGQGPSIPFGDDMYRGAGLVQSQLIYVFDQPRLANPQGTALTDVLIYKIH